MDNRKVGKSLEEYVAARLRDVLGDETIRPTKNSGASTELGDISCSRFICECKKRNTIDITIHADVWNKLLSEIPLGSTRIPIYILENKNKKRWAVMDLENFFNLIKKEN
jgi:hypothetical protein